MPNIKYSRQEKVFYVPIVGSDKSSPTRITPFSRYTLLPPYRSVDLLITIPAGIAAEGCVCRHY